MYEYEGIKKVIYKTIHRSKKTISQIADEMGIDEMSLYKYPLPGESGSNIPLKRIVPLMKVTGDYSLLKHLCILCDHIAIKIPRFKASKGDSTEIISEYQEASAQAFKDMINFFKHPCNETYKNITTSLQTVMEKSIGAQKYIDKEFEGQIEFFE